MTTPCGITPHGCTPSRFIRVPVDTGATSAQLVFEQIHPGEYFGLGILDHNGNLTGTLLPDRGDSVTLPDQPVTVAETGNSRADLVVVFDL